MTVAAAAGVVTTNLERKQADDGLDWRPCSHVRRSAARFIGGADGLALPGLFVALGGGLLFLGRGYPRALKSRGDKGTIVLGSAALVATALSALGRLFSLP